MNRTLTTLAASVVLATSFTVFSTASATTDSMPTAVWQRHACPSEDSSNCYWNAGSAGNGEGHSFYAVRVGHKRVCILYTQTRYARHHNYCTKAA